MCNPYLLHMLAIKSYGLCVSVTMEEMEEDLDVIEEGAQMVFESHSQLLGKGFALSHPPTIMQALEGNLPFCWQSNERAFLKDFVSCTAGTSGGRLARLVFSVLVLLQACLTLSSTLPANTHALEDSHFKRDYLK